MWSESNNDNFQKKIYTKMPRHRRHRHGHISSTQTKIPPKIVSILVPATVLLFFWIFVLSHGSAFLGVGIQNLVSNNSSILGIVFTCIGAIEYGLLILFVTPTIVIVSCFCFIKNHKPFESINSETKSSVPPTIAVPTNGTYISPQQEISSLPTTIPYGQNIMEQKYNAQVVQNTSVVDGKLRGESDATGQHSSNQPSIYQSQSHHDQFNIYTMQEQNYTNVPQESVTVIDSNHYTIDNTYALDYVAQEQVPTVQNVESNVSNQTLYY